MYSLVSVFQARRSCFQVLIENHKYDRHSGKLELPHKPLRKVKMIGVETRNGLYEVVLTVQCSGNNKEDANCRNV